MCSWILSSGAVAQTEQSGGKSEGGPGVMRYLRHMVRGETTEHFLSRRGRMAPTHGPVGLLFFGKEGRGLIP